MSLRGFIDRLRGKPKRVPPVGDGRATDGWQVGDLAECISSGPWSRVSSGQPVDYGPRMCQILRVSDVTMIHGFHALAFHGFPGDCWVAAHFQKIRPNQREACTAAFKRQMKDCRPKVDA